MNNLEFQQKVHEDHWLHKLTTFSGTNFIQSNYRKLDLDKRECSVKFTNDALQSASLGKPFNKTLFFLTAALIWLRRFTNSSYRCLATPPLNDVVEGNYESLLFLIEEVDETDTVRGLLKKIHGAIIHDSAYLNYDYSNLAERYLQLENKEISSLVECALFFNGSQSFNDKLNNFNFIIDLQEGADDEYILKITSAETWLTDADLTFFVDQYIHILHRITEDIEFEVKQVDLMSTRDIKLLASINSNHLVCPEGSFLTMFKRQVESSRDAVAVVYKNEVFTYGKLDALTDGLAARLRSVNAVQTGDLIGVIVGYTEWRIISIIAILKAGAGYVPIKADYPVNRIRFMLSDCACKVVLLDNPCAHLANSLPEVQCVILTNELELEQGLFNQLLIPGNNPFVVLYTSGSSGKPKGVLIEHQNIYDRLMGELMLYGIDQHIVTVQTSNYAFDSSLLDLFLSLCIGGKLVIPTEDAMTDYEELASLMSEQQVTDIQANPNFLKAFLDICETLAKPLPSLERIWCGGESLTPVLVDTVKIHYPHIMINNHYGPTEGTIDAIVFKNVKHVDRNIIGKPIYNMQVYILDDRLQCCPVNFPGEICISGKGLARGYLNLPELTSQKFIAHPFIPGERLYKTGDLGRVLPDATVEYLGRIDDQIKIRGYRIELAEVENIVIRFPSLEEVVVLAKSDAAGGKFLNCYFVASKVIDLSLLRAYLKAELPDFMVPAYFYQLDAFPVTSTGKIDKQQLGRQGETENEISKKIILPASTTENILLEVWRGNLQRVSISTDDNFFEIGGQSIKATQLVFQIRRKFNIKINLKDIFNYPSIIEQAKLIACSASDGALTIVRGESKDLYYTSSAQTRMWLMAQHADLALAYNLTDAFLLNGNLNWQVFQQAYATVIYRHNSLRTTFHFHNDLVMQKIHPADEVMDKSFSYRDLSLQAPEEKETVKNEMLEAFAKIRFNLSNGPLIKTALIRLSEDQYLFLYSMHHIVSDEWSLNIFKEEILTTYAGLIRGEKAELPELPIQYTDFAEWSRSRHVNLIEREFWLKQFEKGVPLLSLPLDFDRSWELGQESKIFRTIDPQTTAGLKQVVRSMDSTLFMTMLGIFSVFLSRVCNHQEVVVGTITSGRDQPELENLIGLFVKTLALRFEIQHDNFFSAFLKAIKEIILNAFQNQNYEFEELVKELKVDRSFNRHPLFDVLFEFQNELILQESSIEIDSYFHETHPIAKFDLAVSVTEKAETIAVTWTYNVKLFKAETIQAMADRFTEIMINVITQGDRPLTDLIYLGEETKQDIAGNISLDNGASLFNF